MLGSSSEFLSIFFFFFFSKKKYLQWILKHYFFSILISEFLGEIRTTHLIISLLMSYLLILYLPILSWQEVGSLPLVDIRHSLVCMNNFLQPSRVGVKAPYSWPLRKTQPKPGQPENWPFFTVSWWRDGFTQLSLGMKIFILRGEQEVAPKLSGPRFLWECCLAALHGPPRFVLWCLLLVFT